MVTWNSLLSAFAKSRDVDGAYGLWQQMQEKHIIPDRFTLVSLWASTSERNGGMDGVYDLRSFWLSCMKFFLQPTTTLGFPCFEIDARLPQM